MAYYIRPRTFSFHLSCNMYIATSVYYYDVAPIRTHIHAQRANIQKCGSHTVLAAYLSKICYSYHLLSFAHHSSTGSFHSDEASAK